MICSDKTGTLTQNKMTVEDYYIEGRRIRADEIDMVDPAQRFLLDCSILCNDSTNENGVEIGDPTETALINLGSRYGVEAAEVRESYPREDEIPFDSDRKMMSTLHRIDGENRMIVKGAVDRLLDLTDQIWTENGIREITKEDKEKIQSQGSTFLLAVALTFPLLTLPGAKAASAINTGQKCSIEFDISGNSSELLSASIPVKLYKVASVDESGNYTGIGAFSKLDLSSVSADNLDAAAATWAERAAEAKKLLKDDTEPTTTTLTQGRGTATGLDTGLYLVDTPKVITPNYTYTFTPYLVSLPTNNYYSGNGASDDWIYDLTKEHNSAVGLKPEQHVRYGNLVINKELVDHNATFGNNATFVFQIDITTLDNKKETRIEELTFDAAGSHSVTIEKIPAGSHVTVTEVYSGASYELASAKSQETDIIANPEKETEVEFKPAEVSFINKHDGRTNGGYGVKNNFKLDENGQYQYTEPAEKN